MLKGSLKWGNGFSRGSVGNSLALYE